MISLGAQEVWGRSMSQKLGGRANIVCLGISDENLRGQRRSRARVSESRGGRAGGVYVWINESNGGGEDSRHVCKKNNASNRVQEVNETQGRLTIDNGWFFLTHHKEGRGW
jgi:hypothetical protein